MTREEHVRAYIKRDKHKQRHVELHKALDKLLADFIVHTGKRPSETSVFELVEWSYGQITNPTEVEVNDEDEAGT